MTRNNHIDDAILSRLSPEARADLDVSTRSRQPVSIATQAEIRDLLPGTALGEIEAAFDRLEREAGFILVKADPGADMVATVAPSDVPPLAPTSIDLNSFSTYQAQGDRESVNG